MVRVPGCCTYSATSAPKSKASPVEFRHLPVRREAPALRGIGPEQPPPTSHQLELPSTVRSRAGNRCLKSPSNVTKCSESASAAAAVQASVTWLPCRRAVSSFSRSRGHSVPLACSSTPGELNKASTKVTASSIASGAMKTRGLVTNRRNPIRTIGSKVSVALPAAHEIRAPWSQASATT